jgi:hypothetical protein
MKRFADSEETIVVIPVVVEIVQVQVTLRTVLVQIRHMTVTIELANRNVQNTIYATTPRILSELYIIRYLKYQSICTKYLHFLFTRFVLRQI